MQQKRKVKRGRKKLKAPNVECYYDIVSIDKDSALITINGKKQQVRKVNFKGKFSSFVSFIERSGINEDRCVFDSSNCLINIRINGTDTVYIWTGRYSDKIFMFNEFHNVINGIVEVGDKIDYKILEDIITAANNIFKLSNKQTYKEVSRDE